MPDSESSGSAARIREVFARAREIPAGSDRDQLLDAVCGTDTNLRREVESLLQADTAASAFLTQDASGATLGGLSGIIGTQIDHYRVLEHIGEGGFGEVYRAEQIEPMRREVALKIIKPGMDSREVIARFESERQALALMDHPNIAHVFDAGTTEDGRLYFVMELACGVPITDYCDDHSLPLPARLRMFRKVCAAVQHAHQKGIIHRDLKPSNIVVVDQDGSPLPKIIDFGIAKSLQGRLTDRTFVTQRELFVGTPAYMSPEQLSLTGDELDTRTDIYSLGVLLYELIAGVQPFESDTLKRAALAEVQRIIREVEPPRPSTRVHTLGDTAREIARHRATEVLALERTLRGDLDWIVMKAIEKDCSRRYQGAGEFTQDIVRFLEKRPVEAGPPSRVYRTRKFISRHRVGVVFATTLVLALICGFVLALVGFSRVKRERDRALTAELLARAEAARSETAIGLIQQISGNERPMLNREFLNFMSASEAPIGTMTNRLQLDGLSDELARHIPRRPEAEAAIRKTIADGYLSLGMRLQAQQHLRRVVELARTMYGKQDVRYADSLFDYASSLGGIAGAGLFPVFDPTVNPNWSSWGGSSGPGNVTPFFQLGRRLAAAALGIYQEHNHLSDQYLQLLHVLRDAPTPVSHLWEYTSKAVEVSELIHGADHPVTARHLTQLGHQYREVQNYGEASILFARAAAILENANGYQEERINLLVERIDLYEALGRADEAKTAYLEILRILRATPHLVGLNCLEPISGKTRYPEIDIMRDAYDFQQVFDPARCTVDYRLRIQTPGTYRLFLRWDSHNAFSDTVYVRIKELADGIGGEVADYYGLVIPDFPGDADFSTLPEWQQLAFFERIEHQDDAIKPTRWEVREAGDYTLQFIESESGAALDAFVIQLESHSLPEREGPDRSPQGPDGSFLEVDGRITVEAENFSDRASGRVTQWLVVPAEHEEIIEFRNFTARGYLQVLPELDSLDSVVLLRNRALAAELTGDWTSALELYTQATTQDPDSYWTWVIRGDAFKRHGDFEHAIDDYTQAIEAAERVEREIGSWFGNDIHAKNERGDCFFHLSRFQEAIADYQAEPVDLLKQVLAQARAGLWDEAFETLRLNQMTHYDPSPEELYAMRGRLHAERGDFSRAREDFRRVIDLDKEDWWAWYSMAATYLAERDFDSYSLICEELLNTEDARRQSAGEMATLFMFCPVPESVQEPAVLLSIADGLLDGIDSSTQTYGDRATLAGATFFRTGDTDSAIELLTRALQSNMESGWGAYRSRWMFFLSLAYHEKGLMDEAKHWYDIGIAVLDREQRIPKDSSFKGGAWSDLMTLKLLMEEAAATLAEQGDQVRHTQGDTLSTTQ